MKWLSSSGDQVFIQFNLMLFNRSGLGGVSLRTSIHVSNGSVKVWLQAYQLKSPQNHLKTIKLHHFDKLSGQPRPANHPRLVYAVFFPQQGCQKHSHCGGESLYKLSIGSFNADRLLSAMNCVLCGGFTCACASIRAYWTSKGSPCFCRKSLWQRSASAASLGRNYWPKPGERNVNSIKMWNLCGSPANQTLLIQKIFRTAFRDKNNISATHNHKKIPSSYKNN